MHNKVDNNNTFSALANWNYGLHYNIPITSNFKLLAGGLAAVSYTHLSLSISLLIVKLPI